jgi:site-specific DNA recombinase
MEPNLFKSFANGAKNIKEENNNCVIYTRVSGAKQMDGLSLETQLNGTNAYSQKNNLLVQEYFGGTYESAATDERKEFQRMIKYLKTSKHKISKVLVYSLERFSRNENSIWLSGQLRKLGIEIISVTQPIDTSNPAGIMQQKMLFIFGEFDNQLRRQKCMAGIKEHLLHGKWVAKVPVGYDIVKVNNQRNIVVNETGQIIKKMFLWKAKERLTNTDIKRKLSGYGLDFSFKRINATLKNPFYCGKLAHRSLEGDVLEGNHEKLISESIFLEVNKICSEKKRGLQTKKESPEISLKRFMKCSTCKQPMRGYIVNSCHISYYKCSTTGCKCNRRADVINTQFESLLASHKIDTAYSSLIKEQLKLTFKEHNATIDENQTMVKRQLTDLTKKIERIEERYILEEITSELYYKYKVKFEQEMLAIDRENTENRIELSKLDEYINFSLTCCSNLHEMWASGDYTQRQELQNTFFEQGIEYNRESSTCRTLETNEFLETVTDLSKDYSKLTPTQLKDFKPSSLGVGKRK